ncbi:beta-N-acetylhexosaminidase [Alkalihalobacillus trypoxylicola]|uniref:Beta-N-acetylhexosaminidase n=1 Tax=Alkalihalobacillus trypoxylicola TaxID=519424 RepID=A0A162F9E8_9BACI|nr:beta-N-acetylhexosaminidase [Alkalihalobacillus trypoxylicola]KYG35089.1 beta-N-acetylhexosaminidase [Alkalihalobacillus trypoxylicola]
MSKVTLEEKLGQLFVVGFNGKKVPKEMKELIEKYHVGNIILFARNIGTPDEVKALTTELQQIAARFQEKPLLICVDQENGVVRRLSKGTTILPGAMATAATNQSDYAFELGRICGEELMELGINWNLAPVLDVNNNADNPVIGVRSFGENPEKVAELGRKSMLGLQAGGMVTTLKHFPGHGDTNIDSHLGLPTIPHSLERLEKVELVPFKACIEAGADTVMSAHIHFPVLEKNEGTPATLSKSVITGLLREQLGFDGVVTTDCMEMDAISKTIGTEKGAVVALQAGIDLIMISHRQDRQVGAIEEVKRALEAGEITEEVIDAAYERVMKLKRKYLTFDAKEAISIQDTAQAHQQIAEEVYQKSITVEKSHAIPLSKEESLLVLEPKTPQLTGAEDSLNGDLALGKALNTFSNVLDIQPFPQSLDGIEVLTENHQKIIVGLVSATQDPMQIKVVEKLVSLGKEVIVIGMRSPYDIQVIPENVKTYLNTYEFSYPALIAAGSVLFGDTIATGKAPVTLTY